jgi:predicted nucleic acid-binding protein
MIVVDSSVWISYFKGQSNARVEQLNQYLDRETVLVGDLILTEILQGFKEDKNFEQAKMFLLSLPFAPMLGKDIALQAAANYRFLRKKGVTIRKTNDMIIGTFCIVNGFKVLQNDKDFIPLAKHLDLQLL